MKNTYFDSQFKKFYVYFSNLQFQTINFRQFIIIDYISIKVMNNLIFVNQISPFKEINYCRNLVFNFTLKINQNYLF